VNEEGFWCLSNYQDGLNDWAYLSDLSSIQTEAK